MVTDQAGFVFELISYPYPEDDGSICVKVRQYMEPETIYTEKVENLILRPDVEVG